MVGVICLLISQVQGFFAKSYGTTREDYCFSVIQTQDNGYAMAGYSGGFLNNGNFLVVKTDSAGALQWAYEYYQSSVVYDEFAWPIVQAADGSYYVAGHGFVDEYSSSNDIVLLKLSSSGVVQWAKSYGTPGQIDYAHTMAKLSDGGLVIAGHGVVSPFPTGQDVIIMKLTPNGDVVWAKQYADVNQDNCYGVIQTSDGGIVAVGFTVRSGAADFDILVIRLDAYGNTLWAKAYGTSGQNDFGYSVAQLSDGNLIVAGEVGGYGDGALKIRLSDGALLWAKVFPTAMLDYWYRPQITSTPDGGFLIPAFTNSYGSGSYDFMLIKMSSDGTVEWVRTFGGGNYDIATCAFAKPDGRLAIGGITRSYGTSYDFALLILRANGTFPGACVNDCAPTASYPSLSTYTLSSLTDWPYVRNDLIYARTDPGVSVTPICDPLYESEDEHHQGQGSGIVCSPFSQGALFFSPQATEIRIYEPDGRLRFSGKLQRGENRIALGRGVYFWKAGDQSGRVAVR